jgi:hypothetical protein
MLADEVGLLGRESHKITLRRHASAEVLKASRPPALLVQIASEVRVRDNC